MVNVEGYTEFAKLFVSVVIPVMSDVVETAGTRDASAWMSGIDMRTLNRSSQAEETAVSENTTSKDSVSGAR